MARSTSEKTARSAGPGGARMWESEEHYQP